MRAVFGLIGVGTLLLAACASVGPPTIERDRFDYVTTISDSWKRQTLLNLLKVRYADAPVFMDVSSVISSYSLEGEISLAGQYAPIGRGDAFGYLEKTRPWLAQRLAFAVARTYTKRLHEILGRIRDQL